MKYIRFCLLLIFIPALILVVTGCSGFGLPADDKETALCIEIGQGPTFARTVFPDFSSLDTEGGKFLRYDIEIAGGGNDFTFSSTSPVFMLNNSTIEAKYPNGGLIYGTYTISVKAYRAGEDGDNYSAFGITDPPITLGPGTTTVGVSIGPIVEEGTTGKLSYTISGTGDAILLPYSSYEPELNPEPDSEDPNPGSGGGSEGVAAVNSISYTLTTDGTARVLELPSGYYILKYSGNDGTDYIDVVNIFKNFTTELVLEL